MSDTTKEEKVLLAVAKNKDIHHILGEDAELFGPFGDMFEWVRDYYIRHKDVPSPTLIQAEFPDFEPGEVDGPTKHHVDNLKSDFIKRRLNSVALTMAEKLRKGETPSVVLEGVSTQVAKIGRFTATSNDLNLMDVEDSTKHFADMRELTNAHGGTPGIATGFAGIDANYPTGLAAGHSIVLMGYTGRGKSMFADLLAVKAWDQGYKPMIFSLEMSPQEQRERIYALMGNGKYEISQFSRGEVDDEDFKNWTTRSFKDKNDFIIISPEGYTDVTPNVVQAKIDTHQPDIVFLDYLQLMTDNGKTQGMTPRMLSLSREIKMMAVSNGIPIVSISSVTDEENDKRDAPPTLNQVAWSKGIEYDANMALSVHRHTDTNTVEVACRKNRQGDEFNLLFDVNFGQGVWAEQ